MLDLHPVLGDPPVEVDTGEHLATVGRLVEPPLKKHIQAAKQVLDTAVGEGLFVREHGTTFPFIYHFDGVDDWLAYMAQWWAEAIVEPSTVETARGLLEDGHGEIRVRQTLYASRLRRHTPFFGSQAEGTA